MASTITDRTAQIGSSAIPNAENATVSLKQPVRVATTANITLSGTQTIDGVAVVANDRVLVKDQSTQTQNGIYVVASGAWTRAKDCADNGDLVTGTEVRVNAGASNGGTKWYCSSANPIVFGTSNITWLPSLSGQVHVVFDVKSSLEAASVDADVDTIFVNGYTTAGDGGAALYKRSASEPSHAGKIQSNDGAWWELASDNPNICQFGADRTGVSDSSAALYNCMVYATRNGEFGTTHILDGEYRLATPVLWPPLANIEASTSARIFTDQVIDSLLYTDVGSAATRLVGVRLRGGQWDCNQSAFSAWNIRDFQNVYLQDFRIINPRGYGINLNTTGASSNCFELLVSSGLIQRYGTTNFTNSVGINTAAVSDSHFNDVVIQGFEYGMVGQFHASRFIHVHVWSWGPTEGRLLYGFRVNGNNTVMSGCQVDDAATAAYEIQGSLFQMVGCAAYLSNMPGNTDNTAIGVTVLSGCRAGITACNFLGYDGSLRLAQDISGSLSLVSTRNNNELFVVSPMGDTTTASETVNGALTTTGAFTVDSASDATGSLDANASGNFCLWSMKTGGLNRWGFYKTGTAESGSNAGSDLSIARFADDGSYLAEALFIQRSTGIVVANEPVRTTAKTVATLPAASASGAGARSFVTDANATTFASIVAGGGANGVPVYSDGTNWRIG